MYALIVGDVVAPVAVRRWMYRRQPDRIDAEPLDVLKLGEQAREVTLPVAVTVAKAADIDLVDHGATPPWRRAVHTSLARWMTLLTRPYALASSAPIQKLRSVS